MNPAPDLEARVRADFLNEVDGSGTWPLDTRSTIEHLILEHAPLLGAEQLDQMATRVAAVATGLGVVEALLGRPDVTDVLINGAGSVWIERNGVLETTEFEVDEADIARLVERTLGTGGVRVDRERPIADGRLADGSRISVVLPPVAIDGPLIAIRHFAVRDIPLHEFINPAGHEVLAQLVERGANVLVFGSTGSGKTTFLNAFVAQLGRSERIVTVEDAAELRLAGDHVVRLEARTPNSEGAGSVTIHDLVRAALRLRPDRVVVGEVRGPEALDMVWAMSSGHDGSLSTIHADGPLDALLRLETFIQMAAPSLPTAAIRAQIRSATDAVVGVARTDGGRREVTTVCEVGQRDLDLVEVFDGQSVLGPLRRDPRRRAVVS
jgi:pilus assembly protein CpaF